MDPDCDGLQFRHLVQDEMIEVLKLMEEIVKIWLLEIIMF